MAGDGGLGFSYTTRKSGDVVIRRDGRQVTVLRKGAATRFLRRIEHTDPQHEMARVTGNYRR